MRTFIAMPLPEHVQAIIFHKFENLETFGIGRGNIVEKDNIHLTLKFLGDLSEEAIQQIKQKLSEIKFSKFEAQTGKIGFFPNEKHIKVIWIELIAGEIFKLQKLIENKLSEIKIKSEDREFQPHITVARIKSIENKHLFLEKAGKINLKKTDFSVDKFLLIKSELTRSGPQYKVLEEFELT